MPSTPKQIAADANELLPANDIGSDLASRIEDSIDRGVSWLLSTQLSDGVWISDVYGSLKSGPGITSLVTFTLASIYKIHRSPDLYKALAKAFESMTRTLDSNGAVTANGIPGDYPTYATCYALKTIQMVQLPCELGKRRRLINYLVASQVGTPQGTEPPEKGRIAGRMGGWDSVGGTKSNEIVNAQVDVAITSLVLTTLKKEPNVAPIVFERGLRFLEACQVPSNRLPIHLQDKEAGGFSFVPIGDELRNKAGIVSQADQPATAVPYGTATIDGLLALFACNCPEDDPRATLAIRWIKEHWQVPQVPGFEINALTHWSLAIRFYYWARLTEFVCAYPGVFQDSGNQKLATLIASLLIEMQSSEGSWENEWRAMREDDKYIATSFALQALAHCRALPH